MSSSVPFESPDGVLILCILRTVAHHVLSNSMTLDNKLDNWVWTLSLDTDTSSYQLGDTYPRCQGAAAVASVKQRR